MCIAGLLCSGLIMSTCMAHAGEGKRNYGFDGKISREVLQNYLSRAVTINGLSFSPQKEDDIRMVKNIGAKFLGRVAYIWGNPWGDESDYWCEMKAVAERLHKDDPQYILQACIFEAIHPGIDNVPVPDWVFKEFGLKPEHRNFRYKDTLFDNDKMAGQWGSDGSVPDISKLETKMWFFYRAKMYIDCGYEGLHLGQIGMIGRADPGYKNWKDVIDRIRRYAAKHARRHYVVIDAHVNVQNDGNVLVVDGKILLDFFSFPTRLVEVPGEPMKATLKVGHADTIYKRSPGGIHPSGWKCEHVPTLVEFDQCHASGREGQPNLGTPFVWGYEEATWFAHQPEEYRNEWLRYAWNWLKENDPNCHFQMPGSIPMQVPIDGDNWYRANKKSAASPHGFSQEETIKAIWAGR